MRILLVTPATPFSRASGAEQRSAELFEALRAHGDVDVVQLTPGAPLKAECLPTPHARRFVQATVPASRLPWKHYQPKAGLTAMVERALGAPLEGYDLVVGRYLWPSCQLALTPNTPCVVDLDDWHYRYAPQAPWTKATIKERAAKYLAHLLARRQLGRLAGAWAVSRRDLNEIERAVPAHLLPNIVSTIPQEVTPIPARGSVLFVGSMWYRPNAEAVGWLLSRVWPEVRRLRPDARLLIVGAVGKPVRDAWERVPGVEAPGFVDSLEHAYAAASVVVAPIFSGGGTNIKVLEAMAHGRPCLTTRFVADGLAGLAEADTHLLVADTPDAFATRLVQALSSPEQHQDLARRARAQALEVCGAAPFRFAVRSLVERLIRKPVTSDRAA